MKIDNHSAVTDVLALPKEVTTRTGIIINPESDVWRIPDQRGLFNLDFADIRDCCEVRLVHGLKLVLLLYLQQKSASHVRNLFNFFRHFSQCVYERSGVPLASIAAADIINYRSQLLQSQEWYFSSLKGLLKKWHALGYPGIGQDALALLIQMRSRGNKKGEAILTHDPQAGPFTDNELQAIQAAVNDAYACGNISTQSYVLVWLLIAHGARPIQYASLKIRDLKVLRANDGSTDYLLEIPRAKKRDELIRDSFDTRPLIRELGEAFEAWISLVKLESEKYAPTGVDDGDLPVFPRWDGTNPPGFKFHHSGESLGHEVTKICSSLKVPSERSDEPLHVFSTRFRRTLGTRAAEEGYGPLVIAELLGHSDTQNAGVYVEATQKIMQRVDKVMALQLAPLAQAFSGMVITDPEGVKRGGDPSARIRGFYGQEAGSDNGVCGKHGFCGASAPVACYTCRNFQAWLDGPHIQVLENLLAERERLLQVTGDERIASVHDRTILAVAEVVRLCDERRQKGGL